MTKKAYSLYPEIFNVPNEELSRDIDKIRQSGFPGTIPIVLLSQNVENFTNNIKQISEQSGNLDEKELQRNFASTLIAPDVMHTNLNSVISYSVNLKKSNGKYAISSLAQKEDTLISKLDLVIDAGEEEILDYNAEFLAKDIEEILGRITFCKTNGIDYRERDKEDPNKFTKYKNVIASPIEFERAVGEIELDIKDNKKTNQIVAELVSNKELVIVLDNNNSQNSNQANDGDTDLTYYSILQSLEGRFPKTNRAYQIAGMSFSINRIERNLKALLKSYKMNDTSMDEILFVAIAYNSYKTEEEVKEVASALGFNKAIGGINL